MPDQERPMDDKLTPAPIRADDAVKFVAAKIRSWMDDDEDESAVGDGSTWRPIGQLAAANVRAVLDVLDRAQFGDMDRYSDGRHVESTADFLPAGNGVNSAHHVWHPDPAAEKPGSCGGALPDGPDGRSLGFFQVTTEPATQELRAYLVRPW